jgi:hypothetical protein
VFSEGGMSWIDESQYLKLWYEKTGNPYFVWSAYKFFRYTNRPVPKWVLYYFDNTAKELMQGTEPLEALDFLEEDGSNMLKRFLRSIEQMHIINEYAELIESETNVKARELLAEKYETTIATIDNILVDAIPREEMK